MYTYQVVYDLSVYCTYCMLYGQAAAPSFCVHTWLGVCEMWLAKSDTPIYRYWASLSLYDKCRRNSDIFYVLLKWFKCKSECELWSHGICCLDTVAIGTCESYSCIAAHPSLQCVRSVAMRILMRFHSFYVWSAVICHNTYCSSLVLFLFTVLHLVYI